MAPPAPLPNLRIHLRGERSTSTVFVYHVPPDAVPGFLKLQDEIQPIISSFPGYEGTDIYPPTEPGNTEWASVIHFCSHEAMENWLLSPVRQGILQRMHEAVGEFHWKRLPSGFGPWFASLAFATGAAAPPAWKMALTVWLGLYPASLLVASLLPPILEPRLGIPGTMLVAGITNISLLTWVILPRLNRVLRFWHQATIRSAPILNAAVVGGILLFQISVAILAGKSGGWVDG